MAYHPTNVSLGQRLRVWMRGLPGGRHFPWQYLLVGSVEVADEIPDELAARTAVLVQPDSYPTWLAFDCPRHPNERIMLNLSMRRRPYWKILEDTRLSVFPSIDAQHSGTRCHFWLKRGRPQWAIEDRMNEMDIFK